MAIRKNKKNILLLLIALIMAILCIILPERIIDMKQQTILDNCLDVPEKYYPTSSYFEVIKASSEKLTEFQKRQLISGKWQSEISEVAKDNYDNSGYQIQRSVMDSVNLMGAGGFFPKKIESSYSSWYNWKCNYMQALDTNFRSYAGFFWKVKYNHYENLDNMIVFATNDGRVIKVIYNNVTGADISLDGEVFDENGIRKMAVIMFGEGFTIMDVKNLDTESEIKEFRTCLEDDKLTESLGGAEDEEIEKKADDKSLNDKNDNTTEENGFVDKNLIVRKISVRDQSEDNSNETSDYYIYVYWNEKSYMTGLVPVE